MSDIEGAPRKRGRPRGSLKFPIEWVREALKAAGGVPLYAAHVIATKTGGSCSPTTIRKYIDMHPELAEIADECKKDLVDIAEHNVFKGVKDGDKTYTILVLKCFARDRGWIDRHEITGPGGGPIRTEQRQAFNYAALTDDELDQARAIAKRLAGE